MLLKRTLSSLIAITLKWCRTPSRRRQRASSSTCSRAPRSPAQPSQLAPGAAATAERGLQGAREPSRRRMLLQSSPPTVASVSSMGWRPIWSMPAWSAWSWGSHAAMEASRVPAHAMAISQTASRRHKQSSEALPFSVQAFAAALPCSRASRGSFGCATAGRPPRSSPACPRHPHRSPACQRTAFGF